jgi:PQQ enzyme-like repeat protein
MKWRVCFPLVVSALFLLMFPSLFAIGQVAVTTYHNDNYRSGLNANETILTPSNVNEVHFGKRLVLPVTGYVYAQPLYVPGVNINGTVHNVVYVATEHDQVYAFDANTGQRLWQASFIGTFGNRQVETVSSGDVGCSDLVPEIGITSTPVIDLGSNQIYVVAKTKEIVNNATTFYQRMHVLDIRTGAENLSDRYFGAPITAKTPGTGSGSSGGYLTFDPRVQHQRSALTLSNGLVFVSWASHCDLGNYHGYVMAFNKGSLRPNGVFVTTPNAYEGGIWASGWGPAVDSANNIYVPTGNGYFDANLGGIDYGDSILRLSWDGVLPGVADYFTPWDQAMLNSYDQDVASGGALLLPDQPGAPYPHLLVQVGKEGTIDLVNRDNMGHFNPAGDMQIVQTLPYVISGVWGAPTMWHNSLYFGGYYAPLKAFYYDPVRQQIQAQYTSATPESFNFPGPTASISANGTINAIAWVIQSDAYQNGNAVLRAYDATNLATEFYNSNMNQARDEAGGAVKFAVPTVADGQVFVGTQNEVDVYSLLN